MATCLVVDPDASFARPLSTMLVDAGHDVEVEPDPARALERIERRRFDVVVCEAALPPMTGLGFLAAVRVVDPGVALIVVTAQKETSELDALGPLAVLKKPLQVGRVFELVATARRDALVALVEDDAAFADNLSEILALGGFSTVHAGSLRGVETLRQLPYLAAVVDLRLPDGPDGAGLRRVAARFPGVPLIVASGLDVKPPVEPLEYLHKPLNAGRLLALVERLHACV